MAEKKRRQGQTKPDGTKATPKPVCPKCGEITVRISFRGDQSKKRAYIPAGWMCPSSTCDYVVKEFVEIEDTDENKKLRNRLSEKSWYDLRAEIMKKDREIETLKKILEFSECDKQEWRDHKEIFNFMVKKSEKLKERIKELEAVRD
jgi:hypothetical protein